jgi:tubulin--tyrosine ligase
VHIAIAPFFGIGTRSQEKVADDGEFDSEVGAIAGDEAGRSGWVKIGEGQVRGPT